MPVAAGRRYLAKVTYPAATHGVGGLPDRWLGHQVWPARLTIGFPAPTGSEQRLRLVRHNLHRSAVIDQRPIEEPASRLGVAPPRHVHVDDLAMLIDRPVDVAPHAADLDIGFVHEPPIPHCVPTRPSCFNQQGREALHPPKHRDMVDIDPALCQQLLHVPIRQAVSQVPAHRHHDHLRREPEPGEGRGRIRTARTHHDRLTRWSGRQRNGAHHRQGARSAATYTAAGTPPRALYGNTE